MIFQAAELKTNENNPKPHKNSKKKKSARPT